jgi:sulfate permease, SulP family
VSREIQARAAEGTQAVVLDAETVPYIDVTAAQMLAETAEDLERRGIKLVLARDVGQVRDLLERAEGEPTLTAYPTVQAAVEAVARGAGDG